MGLGGIEPPTSPLSGVRSSHLSYRPAARSYTSAHTCLQLAASRLRNAPRLSCFASALSATSLTGPAPQNPSTGGAGRDRTGDLLNANQALSQLSYSPLLGTGGRGPGNRSPGPWSQAPDPKILIEASWMQRPSGPAQQPFGRLSYSKGRSGADSLPSPKLG